jgi:nicotinamidase-related amidase
LDSPRASSPSRTANNYQVTILGDCCTTVSQMLHSIALNAVATRLTVNHASEAFSSLATEKQLKG